jgi:hypothetical protein
VHEKINKTGFDAVINPEALGLRRPGAGSEGRSMSWWSVCRWRVLIAFLLWLAPAAVSAQTASVTLAWDPSTGATGYRVKWGTTLGSYPNSLDAGSNTTLDINGLTPGATYWAVVQAYDGSGGVSPNSLPLQFTVNGSTPPACTYSISPSGASVPYSASTGSITVNTQAGCAWTSTGGGFVSLIGGSGNGPGTVTFSAAANTATSARSVTVNVAGNPFTVNQAAAPAPCTYSITPTSATAPATASSGTITVNTQAGCAWTATASGFISFPNGGGTGPGTLTYTIAANTATSGRSATATVAGNSFSVSQAAAQPACTYSISPASANVSDPASTGSINVTTQAGCAWTATTSSYFMSFMNGTGRSGPGSVMYSVTANTSTTPRTASATVAGSAFNLSQGGAAACTYSINPGAANVGYGTATGVIDVVTQNNCAWSATSTSSFLTFQNGTGRSGSGSVTYTVAANSTTSARIGTATVAGNTFSVSQLAAPPSCTFSITPSNANTSAAAGTGTININTQTDCAWTATTTSGFLTFTNGAGGLGSGSATYTFTANTGATGRTATATVGGQTFVLSQAAPAQNCTFTVTPVSTTVPGAAGTGTVAVTTQPDCAWSATSTSTFLTFPNGLDRIGSGSVDFAVDDNTGPFRTGKGTIAGKTFTVYQMAPTCTYTVDPDRTTAPAAGGSVTITVTTQSTCTWTAKSLSTYVTIANGTSRTGTGTVDLSVAANSGTTARTAISAIAGTTVYVTQEGTTGSQPPPPPPTGTPSPWSSDFDGDGKNDLLMQEMATGAVEAVFLDNATVKSKQPLSEQPADANWALVGRGDFNGDGKPDLVWQNRLDGSVTVWFMNGTTHIGTAEPWVGAAAGPELQMVSASAVKTTGRRQGFENPNKRWSMTDTTRLAAEGSSLAGSGDPQWKAVGVGDFNRDGRPDIAWQHAGDGTLAVWLMNGTTVTETVSVTPTGVPDLLWKVVGVGDFNGDGSSDLLWRHMGTGDLNSWLMNGLSRIVAAPLNPLAVRDQNWQVGALLDANGDGKVDIVWEHTDGTIMIWHMNGTTRSTFPTLPMTVPVGWHIVGPK